MGQVALCILLMLALPQVAAADAIGMPGEPLMAGARALEHTAAPAVPARGLDLGLDGAPLRLAQNAPDDGQGDGNDTPRAKGDISPYQSESDRGLSFGFEITPRSRFGNLARKEDVEDPDLGDQLDKLIERPVFGLRGRYRF